MSVHLAAQASQETPDNSYILLVGRYVRVQKRIRTYIPLFIYGACQYALFTLSVFSAHPPNRCIQSWNAYLRRCENAISALCQTLPSAILGYSRTTFQHGDLLAGMTFLKRGHKNASMIISSSRKGLNMVNLVPTKETHNHVQT